MIAFLLAIYFDITRIMELIMSPEFLDKLSASGDMFVFLFTELAVLFLLISFLVAVINQKLPAEKIQAILGGKNGSGYLAAAGLGAVTPFCSCSTIPMLIGLLKARAGFGPTMTFLFTSPLDFSNSFKQFSERTSAHGQRSNNLHSAPPWQVRERLQLAASSCHDSNARATARGRLWLAD